MANVNLTSAGAPQNTGIPYKSGIAIIAGVFLVVLLAYGGLSLYESGLSKKITDVNAEYQSEYTRFTTGNNKNIADFQNRVTLAKTFSEKRKMAMENIYETEKAIISGVYITSFAYDNADGSVALECVANDFSVAAQQMVSFKKSNFFANVSAGDVKRGEDGKVSFEIKLTNKTDQKTNQ